MDLTFYRENLSNVYQEPHTPPHAGRFTQLGLPSPFITSTILNPSDCLDPKLDNFMVSFEDPAVLGDFMDSQGGLFSQTTFGHER